MWKESYRIGISRIDKQHIELFKMTKELLDAIDAQASTETFQKALKFLKEYVIYHFRDEEEYQEFIDYENMEEHKIEHAKFTQTVQNYEKKLVESDFDQNILKDLAGTLTAWLIYHVADADQRIVHQAPASAFVKSSKSPIELFADSAAEVMEKMAGFSPDSIRKLPDTDCPVDEPVFVKIRLIGDFPRTVVFAFSKRLALRLLSIMTSMESSTIDEIVTSALAELTNIACGHAATALTKQNTLCDITPPEVLTGCLLSPVSERLLLQTDEGVLEVLLLAN